MLSDALLGDYKQHRRRLARFFTDRSPLDSPGAQNAADEVVALCERHWDWLGKYFFDRLPVDYIAARCLVSEVFARVLEGLATGVVPESVDRWLWRIARYVLAERVLLDVMAGERTMHGTDVTNG